MSEKESAQDVIDAYRRRQQTAKRAPLIIGAAVVLIIIGIAIVAYWFLGESRPTIAFFATETPTPTATSTPTATGTATSTPTVTPTVTNTPTITLTPTASGPFVYQVEEGDNLFDIAARFNVDLLLIYTLNNLDPDNPTIQVGDRLTIPGPDTELPTETPLPTNLARGAIIDYTVKAGDSILAIALKFNSTTESIIEENDLENENEIFVGQVLVIRANLVTPVPTETPTSPADAVTPQPTPINAASPTATPTP